MASQNTIYIVTHKNFEIVFSADDCYKIIQVGTGEDIIVPKMNIKRDNCDDNISVKNPYYSELTAQYWIWKNDNDTDICGIDHYRRYFVTLPNYYLYTRFLKNPQLLKKKKIDSILTKYDIILPYPSYVHKPVIEFYAEHNCIEDLLTVKKIIKEQYSDYYEVFCKCMDKHWFYPYNMLICKKNIFNKYSEWLFGLMFKVENETDINKYKTANQKRVFGYLSELLMGVWIKKNKLKVKQMPVIMIGETKWTKAVFNSSKIINK